MYTVSFELSNNLSRDLLYCRISHLVLAREGAPRTILNLSYYLFVEIHSKYSIHAHYSMVACLDLEGAREIAVDLVAFVLMSGQILNGN